MKNELLLETLPFLKNGSSVLEMLIFETNTIFTNYFVIISILGILLIGLLFKFSGNHSLKNNAFKFSILCFCFATQFLWLTLFFSSQDLPYENPLKEPIGKGGFPLTCFYYPLHPMGSDFPPFEQWSKFYLNYLFYILITLAGIVKYRKVLSEWFSKPKGFKRIVLASMLLNFIGLWYVFFKFE